MQSKEILVQFKEPLYLYMDSSPKNPVCYRFKVKWYFTTRKAGVNAFNLQQRLYLACYDTAWNWRNNLWLCTIRHDSEKRSGCVDVNKNSGTICPGAKGEKIVAAMVWS